MGVLRAWLIAVCFVTVGMCVALIEPRNTAAAVDTRPQPVRINSVKVSMDQAVKLVEKRYQARVVRAEAQHDGTRTLYILRLLNDSGRVWTVRMDASDGSIQ